MIMEGFKVELVEKSLPPARKVAPLASASRNLDADALTTRGLTPGVAVKASASFFKKALNSMATLSRTMMRSVEKHSWPWWRNAILMVNQEQTGAPLEPGHDWNIPPREHFLAAAGKSASSRTMAAPLPPSSMKIGFRYFEHSCPMTLPIEAL